MFPMWLVLVPLPGTRPVYALLLALYFDALYSPGDSVAGPRIIRNVVLVVRLNYFASQTSLVARSHGRAGPPSAGAAPHPRPRRAQDPILTGYSGLTAPD
jgi:hypothetical protein